MVTGVRRGVDGRYLGRSCRNGDNRLKSYLHVAETVPVEAVTVKVPAVALVMLTLAVPVPPEVVAEKASRVRAASG